MSFAVELDNMRPLTHPLLSSSSSSSSSSSTTTTSSTSSSSALIPQFFSQPSNYNLELMISPNWLHNQTLPESWSQLLMGGLVDEEDMCSFTQFQTKMENWEDQMIYPLPSIPLNNIYHQSSEELIKVPRPSTWSQIMMPNSSPRSCITSFNSNMLDFSANGKKETRHNQPDHSSQEDNSTTAGSPYKKSRVQASSAKSTFKVRKEKLGDRITALHQLVSPFGKTDTASVLLEAIGYIRFLESQIQALSSPYLAAGSANNIIKLQQQPALLNDNGMKRRGPTDKDGIVQEPKDLKSRGLCLVPVSFTLHARNDNGADYWAPAFGGGFR